MLLWGREWAGCGAVAPARPSPRRTSLLSASRLSHSHSRSRPRGTCQFRLPAPASRKGKDPLLMTAIGQDTLGTRTTLDVGGTSYDYYSLATAAEKLGDISRLPFSMKVLLENLLRFED
eukprot:gene23973-25593_t